MEYKISEFDDYSFTIEKYTEPKGFFRNTTGPLKVGEIRLCDSTEGRWFEDFLTEKRICYMELGCINGFGLIYRGEAPRISIGENRYNIPVEERIKFLYEALSSNENYNCLGIINTEGGYLGKKSLFEILKGTNIYGLTAEFDIRDL